MWINGEGFYNYQNETESLGDRLLRCRWGGVGAPTTPPTRVNDGLVVCDSAVGSTAGTVPLYVALNPNPNPNPIPNPNPNSNPNPNQA